jgi:cell division protein FtsI (penicillin-binding protein 3)
MKTRIKKLRLFFIYLLVLLSGGVLTGRLIEIQILNGAEYSRIAKAQSTGKKKLQAERGVIYDRTGREVAINVNRCSLYAYPRNRSEINNIHRYLDRTCRWVSGTSRRKFAFEKDKFTWINRGISDRFAKKVAYDSIPGLFIFRELGRDYPFGQIGRQIVGNTDIDNLGISGLEYGHDSVLAGSPGWLDYLRDGKRNTYRLREIPLVKPEPGNSIVLTIDWYFQEIVEDELKAAVHKYNAKEGTAIFLNCHTGEILAAADYNNNDQPSGVKLRAVSDCFEPGSVLKVVTAAALLEENLIDFNEKIFCENGQWQCGRRRLRDDKKYDSLNFAEIIELSSNIGIGKLALRLGGGELKNSMEQFGFGQKSYLEFPGEASGLIGDPGVWSDYNIAALAMGHSISATPLQVANCIAAVANGGNLYRPKIIGGVISPEGEVIRKMERELLGRTMDEKNAAILRKILIDVVDSGTAQPARSDMIAIAGKTGTAQIPDPEGKGYLIGKYNSSFAAFFPVENPQVAGIVVLNKPKPVTYGGHTAGPAFKNMAERYAMANCERLIPGARLVSGNGELRFHDIPDFVGKNLSEAFAVADKAGLSLGSNDSTGVIVWQYPPAHRRLPGTAKIAVLVDNSENSKQRMTDMVGMNLRTALSVLNYQGLLFEIVGNGIVKKQFPAFGSTVSDKSKCRLVCDHG